MAKSKTLVTKNDLSPEVREKAIALLNQHLADTLDLYTQTKQAHWNLKGMQFYHLHELFGTLAAAVADDSDLIAERATPLGRTALGTVRVAAGKSRLPEYPLDISSGREHVTALCGALVEFGKSACAAIDSVAALGDADTADLFSEASRGVDKLL